MTVRIPPLRGWMRWSVIGWGFLIFLWLGREDNVVWPVATLGAGTALLIQWMWLVSHHAGRGFRLPALPLWGTLFGVGVGIGGIVSVLVLMILKNVRHSHFVPDYPNALLSAMLERLPAWGFGGALIGAGAGVLWVVYGETRSPRVTETRIYFVRHGETDWNVERRFQGQAETDLNANGIVQVQAVVERIAALPETFTAIYSSPQRRAMQTAQPIAARLGLRVHAQDALKEIFCGKWEGLTGEEIEAAFPGQLARWRSNVAEFAMPDGESIGDVQQRGLVLYERILRDHAGEAVLIVGHGASILSLVAQTQGWDLTETWNDFSRRIMNTSITCVLIREDAPPELTRYNWLGDGESGSNSP